MLAAVLAPVHATTAQEAALRTVAFGTKKPPIVRRTNRDGRYAVVLTGGGLMESAPVTAPILVERFSFGWQAIDLVSSQCQLEAYGVSPDATAILLRGMPVSRNQLDCKPARDSGPPAEVEAVRSLMRGPLVPYVAVSGDWALGEWYGAGGGQSLYHRTSGGWKLVTSGGGALGTDGVRAYGVPSSHWCALHIYNATCPHT